MSVTDLSTDTSLCTVSDSSDSSEEYARLLSSLKKKQFSEDEMRVCFDCLDADGDGLVSVKDLRRGMREIGVTEPSDGQICRMASMVDLRGDGRITLVAFARMIRGLCDRPTPLDETRLIQEHPSQLTSEERNSQVRSMDLVRKALRTLDWPEGDSSLPQWQRMKDAFRLLSGQAKYTDSQPLYVDFTDFCVATRMNRKEQATETVFSQFCDGDSRMLGSVAFCLAVLPLFVKSRRLIKEELQRSMVEMSEQQRKPFLSEFVRISHFIKDQSKCDFIASELLSLIPSLDESHHFARFFPLCFHSTRSP